MPFCPNCGKEVSEGITFCPECGQRIKEGFTPEERQKYIEKLKTSIEEEKPAKKTKIARKKLAGIIVACIIGVFIAIGIATSGGETPAPVTSPEVPAIPLTASEQTYTTAMVEHSGKLATALSELSDLISDPQIGNDEWTVDLTVQLVTIQTLYDEAMEMEPPNSMADIHYDYMQAMQHLDTAAGLLREGLDTLDVSLIDQAIAEIEIGHQFTVEAIGSLEEFTATKG